MASPPLRSKGADKPISSKNQTVATSRRPRSAKLNLRNADELQKELRRFSRDVLDDEDIIPRRVDLIRARRFDLRYAIERYHGGFRKLRSKTTAVTLVDEPKVEITDRLDTLEVLTTQIKQFIEQHIVPLDVDHADLARTFFPTHAALRSAGRNDLVRAVRHAGGSRAVAARMGLNMHYHASTNYSGERARFLAEIRRFVASNGETGLFPTAAQLHDSGRLDIVNGIRAHGGAAATAAVLGLKLQRGRPGARTVAANVAANHALPDDAQLVSEGRVDVVRAVRALGGRTNASKILGVRDELSRVARTVLDEAFFQLDICQEPVALHHNIDNSLRTDPAKQPRGGGGGALLPREGGRRRERYYFNNFENLRHELNCFIFDDGVARVMPTAAELIRAGRRDLVRAMQLHGGQKSVAARLGLVRQSMSRKQVLAATRDSVSAGSS